MMELKEAGKSDIADILYLFTDKFDVIDEKLTGELKNSLGKDRMVLAFIGDNPVGFLWSRLSSNEDGTIDDEVVEMIIARDSYGKGVGSALLEVERSYASEKGVRTLRITH